MLSVTNCIQDTIHTIHDWSYDLVIVRANSCSRTGRAIWILPRTVILASQSNDLDWLTSSIKLKRSVHVFFMCFDYKQLRKWWSRSHYLSMSIRIF